MDTLENISIILVKTLYPGNLGSAARAMKNMGFSRLKLVRPPDTTDVECRKMAGSAIDLVQKAEVFPSLDDAAASENLLIALTSARGRRLDGSQRTPREISARIRHYATHQSVGLVFGPERSGLTRSELALCQHRVSIPTNPASPVLNLAQAVLVMCYEITRQRGRIEESARNLSTHREREKMFSHIERALTEVGFLSASNPAPIMETLQEILGRAELDSREVRIVRGMMRQIRWYVRHGYRLGAKEVRKP